MEKEYISRKVLEQDLLRLFEKMRANNVNAIRLPDINSFSFILDSRTGQIIHDGVESNNKVTNIRQTESTRGEIDISR